MLGLASATALGTVRLAASSALTSSRTRKTRGSASSSSINRRRSTQTSRALVSDATQNLAYEIAGFDAETVVAVLAACMGVAAGLAIPIFFANQEKRDKERLEEIRELNRATLRATGEQMSEEEIKELRPSRYLDRREFKDDD